MKRTLGLAAFLVVLGFAFVPQAARAQLGGVDLSAQGFGLQMTFTEPQAPIPPPTLEFELADSEAEFSSGAAHALSSVAWPGPTFADGGPAFCPQYGVPFDCPAYPVRAEAFSPGKPHSSHDDQFGPNTTMQATASSTSASASTQTQSSDQAKPAVVTGDFASSSSTVVGGERAISSATAQVSDLTIAGVVHVDSIVTRAKAVTNGKNGAVSGATRVSGVTVNGQKVTVDRKGVHAGDRTVPVFDPISNGQVQQALGQAGITVKVAAPVDSVKGAHAERSLGGLEVTFEPGAFEDALPPPLGDQLKKYVNLKETITLSIGGVAVISDTLAGYGGYTPPPSPPPTTPLPPGGSGPSTGSNGGFPGGFSGGTPSGNGGLLPPPNPGQTNGGTVGTTPVTAGLALPPVKGVPAGIAIVALLLACGAGVAFRLLAERLVAAEAGRCPLEELASE
jgi:hypothetical protein